jgi:hypothetical protein
MSLFDLGSAPEEGAMLMASHSSRISMDQSHHFAEFQVIDSPSVIHVAQAALGSVVTKAPHLDV